MKLFKRTILSLFIIFFPAFTFAAQFKADLYYGISSSEDVGRLQEFLKDQGVYTGPVTGNFLALTREGVKRFQEREGISPVAGYFGPKTRARANELILPAVKPTVSPTTQDEIAILLAKIKELREKIDALAAAATSSAPALPPPAPPPLPDVKIPSFVKNPVVKDVGYIDNPPLGAKYPRLVKFDWAMDKEEAVKEESVNCTPSIKFEGGSGRKGEYYTEAGKMYSCTASVKDEAGKEGRAEFTFSSPAWVSVFGRSTTTFPLVEVSPLHLGSFTLYNGTEKQVLFGQIEAKLYDDMDSLANRDRQVFFILRNGSDVTGSQISKYEFKIFKTIPKVGEPHIVSITLPFDLLLDPGEEKVVSLWIEQFRYVRSGTLRLQTTKMNTTEFSVVGGFNITLTKEPPL